MGATDGRAADLVEGLADLPIDVAEAMYSPDFVELATLGPSGMPLALPMSFSLDIAGNAVRFSSPLTAGRLANLARDPRCCVSFTRVTTGHPPLVLQGMATLGDVVEGVRRAPARTFTVTPLRILVLDESPRLWRLRDEAAEVLQTPARDGRGRRAPAAAVTLDDLDALLALPTIVAAGVDAGGAPLILPIDPRRDGDELTASLPDTGPLRPVAGPASLLGHTWTRDGPRYLALTGRASIAGSALRFKPSRALRRP